MRIVAVPSNVEAILFDIDRTLYSNERYAELQVSLLVERLARERGEEVALTELAIERWRREYASAHGGAKQSLGNAFAGLGIAIETSVRWRQELIHPEQHLSADPQLMRTMEELRRRFTLVAVTNNPRSVGQATLRALGIGSWLGRVVGLDTTWRSKPAPEPFVEAARLAGVETSRCLSVGDRFDVDIQPALAVGMGGVVVDGVADVYRLPSVL